MRPPHAHATQPLALHCLGVTRLIKSRLRVLQHILSMSAARRVRLRAAACPSAPASEGSPALRLPGYPLGLCSQLGDSCVLAQSASSQGGGVSERAADEPASSGNGAPEASASERYPERNPLSGGWAGGETGLRQWIEVRWQAARVKDPNAQS